MNESKKKITIVCCCYNEEKNIYRSYEKFIWLIEQCPQYDFDILFEDNCSTDNSQELIRNIALKDARVKAIFNQGNYGQASSAANAFCNVSGDAIIPISCDLQEPVEILPEFLQYWEQGYDIVWGQKIESEESKIKYHLRSVFYDIIDFFSDYDQFHHVTGFGVTDRRVLETFKIQKMQDPSIMMRNFVAEYHYKVKLIPYKQNKRNNGKSSYNISKWLDFSISTLCNTSTKPLRLITVLGLVSGFICVIIWIIYLICCLTGYGVSDFGEVSLIMGLFFLMSVQLFFIGIIGEYLKIILKRISHRPLVIESERLNFENNDPQVTICGGKLYESKENNNTK